MKRKKGIDIIKDRKYMKLTDFISEVQDRLVWRTFYEKLNKL